jgi:hypothetical protein
MGALPGPPPMPAQPASAIVRLSLEVDPIAVVKAPRNRSRASSGEVGVTGIEHPCKRQFLYPEVCTGVCTTRTRPRSGEQVRVVELSLVSEHMRVGIRGDGKVTLANGLSDRRQWHPR